MAAAFVISLPGLGSTTAERTSALTVAGAQRDTYRRTSNTSPSSRVHLIGLPSPGDTIGARWSVTMEI